MRTLSLHVTLAALGSAAGWLAALPPAAAATTAVPTVAVAATTAALAHEMDGTLQPLRQAVVAAQVAGNILALPVKAGDRVRAGQVLARIDDREAASGVMQREAALAQAEAELRNARTHLERSRELRAQGFVSQAALDVAQTQFDAARAGAAQAGAARAQAALARGHAVVLAPFDAVVLATQAEVGDLAQPGRPLMTLYAPGRLRAVVQLPVSRAALARSASRVEVQLPAGDWVPVPAPARSELPGADPVAQTIEWRLELPAPTAATAAAVGLPGQAVRVRFGADAAAARPAAPAAPGVASVPAAAVLRRGEVTAVYAVQAGRFVLKPVRLGAALGDRVEVLAGLKSGERVALDPVRAGLAGAVPQ